MERIDQRGDVARHADGGVVLPLQQLWGLIDQVGGVDPVEGALRVGPVKLLQAAREQAEGGEQEDPPRASLLQLPGHVQHAAAGGDHVIDDHNVHARHGAAAEIVGDDGVRAVHDAGIVPPLVEHPDVDAEKGREEDHPPRRALVRCDEHQVIAVQPQVLVFRQQGLGELQGRGNIFQVGQRHDVLHPRVVRVKGDDAADAHVLQLPQHHRAVQRLPGGLPVLPSLVQEGHDHRQPGGLPVAGGDNALEILVVIVRRHPVGLPVHLVGQGIVAYVHENVKVLIPDRFSENPLRLSAGKAGAGYGDADLLAVMPLGKERFDPAGQMLRRFKGNESEFVHAVQPP